jgi:hypothetical protein
MLHDFLSLSLLDRCLSGRKRNGSSVTTIGIRPWFPVDVFLSGTEYWTGPGPFNRTGMEGGLVRATTQATRHLRCRVVSTFATHSGTHGDATKRGDKGEGMNEALPVPDSPAPVRDGSRVRIYINQRGTSGL